jgi:hypothetical protein
LFPIGENVKFKQIEHDRWALLGQAQAILEYGNTVQKCNRVPVGQINVKRRGDRYFYGGLHTCKSSWSCPICTPKKAKRRAEAIKNLSKVIPGESVFITYTIQHNNADKLSELIETLYSSIRYARSGKRYMEFKKLAIGYIRCTEIMYGKNGWHPHVHEVVWLRDGSTIEELKDTLVKHYKSAVNRKGRLVNEHTVDAQRWNGDTDYVTKNQDIEELVGWLYKDGKSSMNVFGILKMSMDDDRYKHLYREYYASTKRRKVTIISRSLQSQFSKLMIDDDDDDDESVIVATIDKQSWKKVISNKARYSLLLEIAKSEI